MAEREIYSTKRGWKTKTDSLETGLQRVELVLVNLVPQANTSTADIAALQADVTDLQTRVTTLEAQVAAISTRLGI